MGDHGSGRQTELPGIGMQFIANQREQAGLPHTIGASDAHFLTTINSGIDIVQQLSLASPQR